MLRRDAPFRRRLLVASLLACLGGTGCGMFSHEADRQVEDTLADPSDVELFFLGSIESKEGSDDKLHPHKRARPSGPVGFAR